MKLFLTITLLCTALTCFAQEQVFYFKNSGKQIQIADSADYTRVIRLPDSGKVFYKVTEYYKNGKPKLTAESSRSDFITFQGEKITYFENGVKKSVSNYSNGKLTGPVYEFFPNGKPYRVNEPAEGVFVDNDNITANYDSLGKQLVTNGNGYYLGYDDDFKMIAAEGRIKDGKRDGKWLFMSETARRVEIYADKKFVEGLTITLEGDSIKYKQRESAPEFKGGLSAFGKFLEKNIRYPKLERKNNIQGRVVISFVVQKDGSLAEMFVVTSPNEALGNEALRVLQLSPAWTPGMQYGRPVRVQYTVPINFSLGSRF